MPTFRRPERGKSTQRRGTLARSRRPAVRLRGENGQRPRSPSTGRGSDQSRPPVTTAHPSQHPLQAPSFRLAEDSRLLGGARRAGVPGKCGRRLPAQAHRLSSWLCPSPPIPPRRARAPAGALRSGREGWRERGHPWGGLAAHPDTSSEVPPELCPQGRRRLLVRIFKQPLLAAPIASLQECSSRSCLQR